jgi:hypothetical protein
MGELLPCDVPPPPCLHKGYLGIGTKGQQLLATFNAIFQPPALAPTGEDEKIHSATIGQLELFFGGLGLKPGCRSRDLALYDYWKSKP